MARSAFESPETLTAYATIDAAYFCLKKLLDAPPRSPIERMVDEACGIDKEKATQAVSLLEQIIENKKIVEAETTYDEQTLEAVKKYLNGN